jgi:signal transduction histidine kinase
LPEPAICRTIAAATEGGQGVGVVPNEHEHKDSDGGFTLDPSQVAEHRAAGERRMHTIQMPMVRALGFIVVCVLVILDDWRTGDSLTNPSLLWLIAGNLLYATLSWPFLRWVWGRGGLDWSFVFLHVDVLVWLLNLHHLEPSTLFFAYFLLMRVADQVGFGFRRAFYFNHVVAGTYLAYSLWIGLMEPARAQWAERLVLLVTMYLLGAYLATTGLVTERLRRRTNSAIRAARDLVANLEHQRQALQTQAVELEQARRLAESANVAKSQFLATISHEFRTPLNGILGTTELLLDSPLTANQRRFAKTAHLSATALLALVDVVIDLSRIEAGKFTLRHTSFDLRALVDEAMDLMAAIARDKPIALDHHLPPQLPERLLGDPVRLRQLLVNLLHNGVKFTDRGSVTLLVALLGHDDAGALRLRFEVRDTGQGIHPGRRVDHAPPRRQRPRPGNRQRPHRVDGRAPGRQQPPRRRLDFLVRAGAAAGCRCACEGATAADRDGRVGGTCAAGRRRQRQSDGGRGDAHAVGLHRRGGGRWQRGARSGHAQALRPDPDGLPHAGDGWLRGDAPHPRRRVRPQPGPHADRGADGRCVGR